MGLNKSLGAFFHFLRMEGVRVNLLRSLWRDETGVQALETGLIAALIAIVIVGAVRNIQLGITSTLNIISTAL